MKEYSLMAIILSCGLVISFVCIPGCGLIARTTNGPKIEITQELINAISTEATHYTQISGLVKNTGGWTANKWKATYLFSKNNILIAFGSDEGGWHNIKGRLSPGNSSSFSINISITSNEYDSIERQTEFEAYQSMPSDLFYPIIQQSVKCK